MDPPGTPDLGREPRQPAGTQQPIREGLAETLRLPCEQTTMPSGPDTQLQSKKEGACAAWG